MAGVQHHRFRHLRILWSEGLWGRLVGAAFTFLGILVWLRDDFLSAALQAKLKGPVVAQLLSWQVWTIGVLLIVVGWVFEASFRSHRRILEAVDGTEIARAEA